MKIRSPHLNRYGALSALMIVVAIGLAEFAGAFRTADEFCYDFLAATGRVHRGDQVLLVDAPKSWFQEPDCAQLLRLIDEIGKNQAEKIGLAFEPDPDQVQFLCQSPQVRQLVVGSRFGNLASEQEQARSDRDSDLQAGFLDLLLEQAVYREHQPVVRVSGKQHFSFELVLVRDSRTENRLPQNRFRIRYVGGPNSIPNVNAEEIEAGEIVTELIQDKLVLVGPRLDDETGFVTPSTRNSQRMSQLELRGNVVNSLIQRNYVSSQSDVADLLILFCSTLVFGQIFRQVSGGRIVTAGSLCALSIALISLLTIHVFSVSLPLTAVTTSLVLSLMSGLYLRFHTLSDLVDNWQLMRRTESQSDWKAEEKDTWTLISDSVYQIFYPNRMVLMELKPGATHVTTTKMIHCTTDDIVERRRDFNRSPYRDAVEMGVAMQIQNRQFFDPIAGTECIEFIAPMIVVSELVGFMMLEMTVESVKNWHDFENFLTHFTSDMAMLVNNYRLLEQQESRERRLLEKLKELPEQNRKRGLFQSELVHRNLENLVCNVFETIQTASLICDVFGRVLKTNFKMVELLKEHGVVVGKNDCVGVLETLTGANRNECRKLFRQCVVDGRSQQIFLPEKNGRDAPQFLYLEPINSSGNDEEICSRFLCVQVVEGKIFQESRQWQQDFSSKNQEQVSSRLAELKSLSQQLGKSHPADALGAPGVEQEIAQLVEQCQSILGSQFGEGPDDLLEFDSRPVWDAAIERMQPKLEARAVRVVAQFDSQPMTVLANPLLLERVFEAMLDCISDQAAHESEIVTTTHLTGGRLVYVIRDRLSGTGTQIFPNRRGGHEGWDPTDASANEQQWPGAVDAPDQTVEASLLDPAQIDQFQEIESWLSGWGASLTISRCENYRIIMELAFATEWNVGGKTGTRNGSISAGQFAR